MRDTPDTEPAEAAQVHLPETVARVYDSHFDFVWRNARRLGVPNANADDVVQDVFIVVQRRIADFDGRTSMQAWIFGILLRVVSDHRRNHRRKGARNVSLEHDAARDIGAHPLARAASG
jgi:RNA polymerase sigma-70 factor, ECF subfamily